MPYETVRFKHVFMACWKTPLLSDGPLIVHETKQFHEEVNKPVLFVSVAPMNSPPPPDDLRKYMGEHVDEMLGYCSELHIVIEGTGFMQSAKRMAMASIVLISGMRKRMFVHESVEKARAAMPVNDRDPFAQAIARAESAGLIGQARKLA